jgi:hypothetical protein
MSLFEKPSDLYWVRSCTVLRQVRCVSWFAHVWDLGLRYMAGDRFLCTRRIYRGGQKDPGRNRMSTPATSFSCLDIGNVCKPISAQAPVNMVSNWKNVLNTRDRHTLTRWQSLSLITHSSQGHECSSSRRLHLAPIARQSKQPRATG